MWMSDYWAKTQVININEFTVGSTNCLVWKLGLEFEIALTDGGELNFDKAFLHFNVKKKIYPKVTFPL